MHPSTTESGDELVPTPPPIAPPLAAAVCTVRFKQKSGAFVGRDTCALRLSIAYRCLTSETAPGPLPKLSFDARTILESGAFKPVTCAPPQLPIILSVWQPPLRVARGGRRCCVNRWHSRRLCGSLTLLRQRAEMDFGVGDAARLIEVELEVVALVLKMTANVVDRADR